MTRARAATESPEVLLAIIRAQTEIAQLGLDLGSVMALVADRVRTLTHATGAVVELAEGEDMVYRAGAGIGDDLLGLRLKRQGSLSGLCVASNEILSCTDSEIDDRVDREACRKVGLRSMMVAPLSHDGTTVGVLKVASAAVAAFSEEDRKVLQLMSGLIAAAMFHAARNDMAELYHRATHDPLTNLANRALFYDRLRQALALAERRSAQLGIINLDMDGLKAINDNFGHRAGDAAIRETASRLSLACRRSDTVARLGGDEFAIILTETQDKPAAEQHVQRLIQAVREPYFFENNPLALDASIGLSVYPEDGRDPTDLIDRADRVMYERKRLKKAERYSA
ncbi:MAG TPA: sensor domain-containing diguanylate cyclase [Terriglobales bacterium]|nr:sensor domain-containing diguanylate cyclase [Terriglobales bacterium]